MSIVLGREDTDCMIQLGWISAPQWLFIEPSPELKQLGLTADLLRDEIQKLNALSAEHFGMCIKFAMLVFPVTLLIGVGVFFLTASFGALIGCVVGGLLIFVISRALTVHKYNLATQEAQLHINGPVNANWQAKGVFWDTTSMQYTLRSGFTSGSRDRHHDRHDHSFGNSHRRDRYRKVDQCPFRTFRILIKPIQAQPQQPTQVIVVQQQQPVQVVVVGADGQPLANQPPAGQVQMQMATTQPAPMTTNA